MSHDCYAAGVEFEHDDLFAPEDLDAELAPWLEVGSIGQILRHPLVYAVPYVPALNRVLNKQYETKKAELEHARSTSNWPSFLLMYERPWRAEALRSIEPVMSDKEYWSMLSWVWQDSENIPQNPELWDLLLRSDRQGREHMMTERERQQLDELPGMVTVYQGHTHARTDGWSFTTDKRVGIWFAQRFAALEGSRPEISRGVVPREKIVAYLLRRNEYEVLADPTVVTILDTRNLPTR